MKPNDVYAMPAQSVSRSPSDLAGCYYNHLEGSGIDEWRLQSCIAESDRLEVRTIKFFDYDGRRYWKLATVWFDGKPVMVTQNAGREGDDHARRFITDEPLFRAMCSHVASMLPPDPNCEIQVFDPDAEMGSQLTDFYNQALDEPFERYSYG